MFVLKIPLTASTLCAIKRDVGRRLPDVKSSHRCEAIARGLGQRTYASALTLARSSEIVTVIAQGDAFVAYLSGRGFASDAADFYRAIARTALGLVSAEHPRVTIFGIGAGQPQRLEDGRRETPHEHYVRLQEGRTRLEGDEAAEAFLVCLALLARVSRTKTVRPKTNSYWIKHIAENFPAKYPEGGALGPRYIPNGALIAAAIHAGFEYRTHVDDLGYDSLNASFNMSHADLLDLDCEMRPEGARAQERRRRNARQALRR